MWSLPYFQNIIRDSWQLDELHRKIIRIQLIIRIITGGVIILSIIRYSLRKILDEWILLEIIWTLAPGLVLVWLGIPRLNLLYQQERLYRQPESIIKVIGHQWYWEYNLPEIEISIESITTKERNLFPLADTNERLILPFKKNLLFLVTSADVIHRFALPSLGLKADANPGRLNSVSSFRKTPGWLIGQCRELCGSLHSNISIRFEFTSPILFVEWVKTSQD